MSNEPVDIPGRIEQFTGTPQDKPLPPLVEGWCPTKERDTDGDDRICTLLEGHNGDCDMQEVKP